MDVLRSLPDPPPEDADDVFRLSNRTLSDKLLFVKEVPY